MKGFASTLVLISILSLLVFQLSLSSRLYSSKLQQKESITLTQRMNEKIYSMQDGLSKTVYEANKDLSKKTLTIAGEAITLLTEDEARAKALDEAYICYKMNEWAEKNNYLLHVSLINPIDLKETKPDERIILKQKQYYSISNEIKKATKNKLILSNVLLCTAFIHSENNSVKVKLNEDLPIDSSYSTELISKLFAFSIESDFFNQKAKALVPGGNEL